MNWLTPPPGVSLEGVIRGRGERILIALIIGQRKIIICKLNNIILVFNILPTLSSPKRWIYTPPPHAPRWLRHLSIPPCVAPALFWLVVVCAIIDWRPSKPLNNLSIYFFIVRIVAQINAIMFPPHALTPMRLLYSIPPTAAANSYLIVVSSN